MKRKSKARERRRVRAKARNQARQMEITKNAMPLTGDYAGDDYLGLDLLMDTQSRDVLPPPPSMVRAVAHKSTAKKD